MKIENLLRDQIKKVGTKSPQNNQLIKVLLGFLANLKDNEINKRLLGELVSKYALAEKQLRNLSNELIKKQQLLDEDLKAAAWIFEPCELMGGDIFNFFQIDPEHLGIYMLDVSGHGVPAAMITVSVSQFLQQNIVHLLKDKENSSLMAPAQVLHALDKEFPFERFNNFFSITYVVINTKSGDTIYSNGGHPYPILLRKNNKMELLNKKGPIIGFGDLNFIDDRKIEMKSGDKLFIYTDGIVEYQNHKKEFYGEDRFYRNLKTQKNESVQSIVDQCLRSLMEFGNNTRPQDDITLFGLELK
jgi:sigma-B regulation protein RsbU (phosphoserine phosphatase)